VDVFLRFWQNVLDKLNLTQTCHFWLLRLYELDLRLQSVRQRDALVPWNNLLVLSRHRYIDAHVETFPVGGEARLLPLFILFGQITARSGRVTLSLRI